MDLKSTYNQIAEDFHKDHLKDDWWIRGADRFASLFRAGDLILDAGCGGGTQSKYLVNKGLKVIGVDFSEKMIKIAKQEVPGGEFFVMDIREVDKLEREFDGIFAQAILLHIPEKEIKRILQILLNKLKPKGYLFIAVKEIREGQKEEEMKVENDYGYQYKRFFTYFTTDKIKKHLNDLEMEICWENITPSQSGNTRWLQVIGQKK